MPFADGVFDDAIASLVLHYLQDWSAPLAELRRLLRPAGRLLLSVNHPLVYPTVNPGADYFAVTQWTDEYTFDGRTTELTFWHRPLHAMTDAFTSAGFRLRSLGEPPISSDTPRELIPPQLAGRRAFLCFLFVVLEAA